MTKRTLLRAALIVPMCLALGACAFRSRLEGVAVNHNEMVANTANQLTLMNILRAKEREPLHFTSISKLNGSAGLTAKASGNVAAKGGTRTTTRDAAGVTTGSSVVAGTEVITPALEAQVTGSSAFDVTVLDTQEFYQGILGSVPAGTVAHYLHQGWPRELISSLFIEAVEFVPQGKTTGTDGREYQKGQVIRRIANDPRSRSATSTIRQFFDCYRLVNYSRETPDQPLVQVKDIKGIELDGLAILDGEKYDLKAVEDAGGIPRPVGDYWITRKGKTADALMLALVGDKAACEKLLKGDGLIRTEGAAVAGVDVKVGAASGRRGNGEEVGPFGSLTFKFETIRGRPAVGNQPATADVTPPPVVIDINLTLRSIDGVIYFVGECLRSKDTCPALDSDRIDDALMVVVTERPVQVFTSASFRGETYYVPAGQKYGGRSSQVFALIQQLVNLQKSAKERPSTQTVRVVQ